MGALCLYARVGARASKTKRSNDEMKKVIIAILTLISTLVFTACLTEEIENSEASSPAVSSEASTIENSSEEKSTEDGSSEAGSSVEASSEEASSSEAGSSSEESSGSSTSDHDWAGIEFSRPD